MSIPIQHIKTLNQRRVNKVHSAEISGYAISGADYAAAIVYCKYLGMQVVGKIEPWVQRLLSNPRAVPGQLYKSVSTILYHEGIALDLSGRVSCILEEDDGPF